MFGQVINFYEQQFKHGSILVKGIALVEGEIPPLTETIYRVFTVDYLERQKAALAAINVKALPEEVQLPPFSLDNMAVYINAEGLTIEHVVDAFAHWGTLVENDWGTDIEDATIVTLAQHSYEDIGVVFFYRTAFNVKLGQINYLEYQELA